MGVNREEKAVRDASTDYDFQAAQYQQTEVGVVPADWEMKQIGDIAFVFSGGTPNRKITEYWDGDVPWITTTQIAGNEITQANEFITAKGVDESSAKWCKTGTILMAMYGQGKTRGKVAILGFDATINQACAAIELKDSRSSKYVLHVLNYLYEYIREASNSGGQENLSAAIVKNIRIPYPTTQAEQSAIATALSDVDALLEGLDRLIAKKRDLKQATMQQLLTGQSRLPGFEGEWQVKPLGHAGHCLRGVSYHGEADLLRYDTPKTVRLLRANNVQNANVVASGLQYVNSACVSAQQVLRRDDVLICMANGSKALVGKAGAFRIDDGFAYTFGAFMGCFRTNTSLADPRFIYFIFQTKEYRDYINILLAGSSINNLRPSSIELMEFAFPTPDEQSAIADVLSEMDAEIEALEQRRAKTAALKQAMMQELLTGRTRLVKSNEDERR